MSANEKALKIWLTDRDYCTLCHMMGFAVGAWTKNGELPAAWRDLVDWIIIQGDDPNTYTYFNNKEELRLKKEAELLYTKGEDQ